MAVVNNDPGVKKAEDFSIRDRPMDAPKFDASGIFKGIENLFDTITSVKDTNNQKAIEDTIRREAEVSNDIVTDGQYSYKTAENAPATAETVPQDLQKSLTRVENLKTAFGQGKVNEAAYYARLNAVAKELRVKFPGYDSIIDQKFSAITGKIPGNALRDQIIQDAITAQRSASDTEKEWRRFENEASKDGHLPPNYDVLSRTPEGRARIQAHVYRMRENDALTARTKAELETKKAVGEAKSEETFKTVSNIVNGRFDHFVKTTFESAMPGSSGFQGLVQMLSKARDPSGPGGESVTDQERQALMGIVTQFEGKVYSEFDTLLHQPGPNGAGSFASSLDRKQIDDLRKNYQDRWASFKDMITNNQTGLLAWNKTLIDSIVDGDAAAKLQGDEFSRHIGTLRKVYGDQSVNLVILENSKKFKDAATFKASGASLIKSAATGEPMKDTLKNEKASGSATVNTLNMTTQILSSKEASPEVKMNVMRSLFGPGNATFLQEFPKMEDKVAVFKTLVNPANTAIAVELSKTDPTVMDNYVKWVENSAVPALARVANNTVISAQGSSDVKLSFDTKTGQFALETPVRKDGSLTEDYAYPKRLNAYNHSKEAVDTLNTFLKAHRDVVTAEGKRDPQEATMMLLKAIGSGPKGDNDRPLTDLTKKAVDSAVAKEATGGGKNTKTPFGIDLPEVEFSGVDKSILNGRLTKTLETVQSKVNFPIKVISGYRTGNPDSQHYPGPDGLARAVDISLKGLDDNQRTELVAQLVEAGIDRIGAYSGNTGLHIDIKEQRMDSGAPWPMFDKSRNNMDRAPEWYREGLKEGWYRFLNRHDPSGTEPKLEVPQPPRAKPQIEQTPLLPPVPGKDTQDLGRASKGDSTFFDSVKEPDIVSQSSADFAKNRLNKGVSDTELLNNPKIKQLVEEKDNLGTFEDFKTNFVKDLVEKEPLLKSFDFESHYKNNPDALDRLKDIYATRQRVIQDKIEYVKRGLNYEDTQRANSEIRNLDKMWQDFKKSVKDSLKNPHQGEGVENPPKGRSPILNDPKGLEDLQNLNRIQNHNRKTI